MQPLGILLTKSRSYRSGFLRLINVKQVIQHTGERDSQRIRRDMEHGIDSNMEVEGTGADYLMHCSGSIYTVLLCTLSVCLLPLITARTQSDLLLLPPGPYE